jgi:hypothetical protein
MQVLLDELIKLNIDGQAVYELLIQCHLSVFNLFILKYQHILAYCYRP